MVPAGWIRHVRHLRRMSKKINGGEKMNLSFFNSCRFEVKVDTTCVGIEFPGLMSAFNFCRWIMLYDNKVNLCAIDLVYVDNDSGFHTHIIESWFYSRKDHEAMFNKAKEEFKKDMENYFME